MWICWVLCGWDGVLRYLNISKRFCNKEAQFVILFCFLHLQMSFALQPSVSSHYHCPRVMGFNVEADWTQTNNPKVIMGTGCYAKLYQ